MSLDKRKLEQIEMHQYLADQYAQRYCPEFARIFQQHWNDTLLKEAPLNVSHIYDCGCGTGILLKEMQHRYPHCIGSDLSFEMLSQAPKGVVCVADAERPPIRANTFEAVTLRGVLHHLPNINQALVEIHRLLTPTGTLIVSEPCNDTWLVRVARRVMYSRSDHFSEEDIAFYTPELIRLVEQAGFEIAKVQRFGYFAYIFAGFPDVLPWLNYVPFASSLTQFLILIDRLWARIPLLNRLGLHIIITAHPWQAKHDRNEFRN